VLNDALSRALSQTPPSLVQTNDDAEVAKEAFVELGRRVSREMARRKRLEECLASMASNIANAKHRAEQAEHENRYLRSELASVEAQVSDWLKSDGTMEAGSATEAAPSLMLGGMTLLYVGGRTHQVPQLKAVVERAGGVLLYHDGGIEHAPTLLPGRACQPRGLCGLPHRLRQPRGRREGEEALPTIRQTFPAIEDIECRQVAVRTYKVARSQGRPRYNYACLTASDSSRAATTGGPLFGERRQLRDQEPDYLGPAGRSGCRRRQSGQPDVTARGDGRPGSDGGSVSAPVMLLNMRGRSGAKVRVYSLS
jgi:hypothetical protein